MKFDRLVRAKILRRYKRFLVDVVLDSGEEVTAHLANTGSMKSCIAEGDLTLLSFHDNPKRKLKYSVEIIYHEDSYIGVNTHNTNKIVFEGLKSGVVKELRGLCEIFPEVKYRDSRLDFLLTFKEEGDCFVEVKSVTLKKESGVAAFPDAVTKRGLKHLNDLLELKKEGKRSVLLFVVQREDVDRFEVAKEIDPAYYEGLKKALAGGVELLIYQCKVNENEICLSHSLKNEI